MGAFPVKMSRKIDGKTESTTVQSAAEQRTHEIKGWFVDENQDGIEDAAPPSGGEFPKMLHGVDKDDKPMTKVVKSADEEKAARKDGWGDTPKQDHGPTKPAAPATPKTEAAAAKAEEKSTPKKK